MVSRHQLHELNLRTIGRQLSERIDKAVTRALPLVKSSLAERLEVESALTGE
jgi:hypothetical protein